MRNRYDPFDPFNRPMHGGPHRRVRVPVRTEGDPLEEEGSAMPERTTEATSEQQTAEAARDLEQELAACREALEAAQAEAAEWKDRCLRMQADLENTRKRLERRYAEELEREKERILQAMLPLADHLEAALQHATGEDEALRQGVELTLKAFRDTLASLGVKPIEALNKPFDPNLHEAVAVEPSAEVAPGTVVAEERTGYTYRDRLLRPTRVRVSQ